MIVAALTAWAVTGGDDESTSGVDVTDAQPLPARDVPRAGTPAPDFELRTLNGDRVTLAALRGRPIVVNFWASYCHPCRQEFPLLRSALSEHRGDRLAIVGIDYRDIASDARAFAEQERAKWPMGFDEDGAVAHAYGVRAIPQTFFVDRRGTIRARVFGEMSARDLQRDLRKIIPPT